MGKNKAMVGLTGALALLLAFGAYVRPFDLQAVRSLQSMGFAYLAENPKLFIDREGMEDRLAAIGLEAPIKRVLGMFEPDLSAANKGQIRPFASGETVEDAKARRALPPSKIKLGLLSDPDWTPSATAPFDETGFRTWLRAHGDDASTKYSALVQITAQNVTRLEPAWSFDSSNGRASDGRYRSHIEASPVFADGLIYAVTPQWSLIAVEVETGELVWVFKAPQEISRRGFLYWPGDGGAGPRIFAGVGPHLVALDPKTGERIKAFGGRGYVEAGRSRISPANRETRAGKF
ncbi:MAG: hypothetical protein AAGL49_12775, partial [Pseudomonadota bacterium]